MKRIENLHYIIALIIFLTQGGIILAQKTDYWGPDTTLARPSEINTYGEILDYQYGQLAPYMTTDILVDRNPNYTRRPLFEDQRFDATVGMDDFFMIQAEMEDAKVPYPDDIFGLFEILEQAEDHFERTNEVLFGICTYRFNQIKEQAKINEHVYWDAYELKVAGGFSGLDVLDEKEVFACLPLKESVRSEGPVTFRFQEDQLFTNTDDHIDYLEVDFGDGAGPITMMMGDAYTANYAQEKTYEIILTARFTSGKIKHSKTSFKRDEPVITFVAECGKQIPVIQTALMVELPGMMFEVNAPEIISNPKNDNGLVKTKAGVWYGCDSVCELDKPFIVISGYGPAIGKKTIWSTDPETNLYNHVNGIYGKAAFSYQNPGLSNGSNILYELRNEGYDIVILEFENGVDYPQNHAEAIIKLIEIINEIKEVNDSPYENVVMGQSMGGITSRLALAKWEKTKMIAGGEQFEHHQCRTWISWEGEMQGATIPMGIQLFAKFISNDLPMYASLSILQTYLATLSTLNVGAAAAVSSWIKDKIFYQAINNPGAKSMLTYHFSNNDQGNDAILHRHPLYEVLMDNFDYWGYPEHVRRVAIADGSSIVERPIGLDMIGGTAVNTCLINVHALLPKVNWYIHMKANTGEVSQNVNVFKSKFLINGFPIPACTKTIDKIYTKAEYAAPGAYERFYDEFMYPLANANPLSCVAQGYKAPFVPTTSAFDVQDDFSNDYSYDVAANLLFKIPGFIGLSQTFGYPHLNSNNTSMYQKTPFDACLAHKENRFHLHNPSMSISNFMLSETSPDTLAIQNRQIGGHSELYRAKYVSNDAIISGRSVTLKTYEGNARIRSNSDVQMISKQVLLKHGTRLDNGSKVLLASNNDPIDQCVFFGPKIGGRKTGDDANYSAFDKGKTEQQFVKVFPNPNVREFELAVDERFVGESYYIYDALGQLLNTGKVESTQTRIAIELPHIAFLKMIPKEGETITVKLIRL